MCILQLKANLKASDALCADVATDPPDAASLLSHRVVGDVLVRGLHVALHPAISVAGAIAARIKDGNHPVLTGRVLITGVGLKGHVARLEVQVAKRNVLDAQLLLEVGDEVLQASTRANLRQAPANIFLVLPGIPVGLPFVLAEGNELLSPDVELVSLGSRA